MSFLTRVFAVIGFFTVILIVIGAVVTWRLQYVSPAEPQSVVLTINFDQPIVEQTETSPIDLALHEQAMPLLDILHAIDAAKSDPHVKALAANFGTMQPSLAQAEEIRAALERFKEGGKPTYAFATSYGGFAQGNRAYYLASVFDNIWLQPVGEVGLAGLAIQAPFAKKTLDKIGADADFMRREEYKSVMETFTRENFSPPVHANMQSMLDDLAEQEASGIAEARKWDVARVRQLMSEGPFTANEALKAGLVTHIGYADEMEKEIKQKVGGDAQTADVEDYLGYGSREKQNEKPKAVVALIYGNGLITDHALGPADISGDELMGADTISGAFDAAAKSSSVKAIIFRLDSPGGSPEASETIRRAMIHAENSGKPVFVSMGDVAASGGYWVAMNGSYIAAEPGTLTGSIGVVAGKFVLGGLMQKIGIDWDTLKTTDDADMWSMTRDFTPAQSARVNALLDETYQTFVRDVSEARKIPLDKMPDIAKGRVWTGQQAQKIGLVDELGGYDVTLAAVRKRLGLSATDLMSLEVFPPPLTPAERVLKLLKGVGLESLEVRSMLSKWQGIVAGVKPLWDDMYSLSPVKARAPSFLIN